MVELERTTRHWRSIIIEVSLEDSQTCLVDSSLIGSMRDRILVWIRLPLVTISHGLLLLRVPYRDPELLPVVRFLPHITRLH